jgi:hypothetical protein
MTEWQTPVTRIVLVKCHACKVPPGYYIQPSYGPSVHIPQTFAVPKNILVIESSRQGFITSCPRRIEHADGVVCDNPREPLHTFLASIANTRGTLTFQDVINRFSQTIVPSKKKQRKEGVSYQLNENMKGVARVRAQTSDSLTMNESLLFGSGVYCDQGIFATNPGINPRVREVPSEFGLINIHDYPLDAFGGAVSYADVRKIDPENFFGQYHPAKGTIGDHALLSEILNNDFIDDGTAVILIACKGICGSTGFRHGEHDDEFYDLFASEEETAELERTRSFDYPGTLKKVVTNDAPNRDIDDDDDDGAGAGAGAGNRKKGGGKVNMYKFTIKNPKHKTKPKTKKRRKRNNKNKNKNKNKKRTVSASSSAVK